MIDLQLTGNRGATITDQSSGEPVRCSCYAARQRRSQRRPPHIGQAGGGGSTATPYPQVTQPRSVEGSVGARPTRSSLGGRITRGVLTLRRYSPSHGRGAAVW